MSTVGYYWRASHYTLKYKYDMMFYNGLMEYHEGNDGSM